MADTTIPNTGDPRVDAALERIRGRFTDLEDAMLIQVHLEKRASERMKEHAKILADHEAWVVQSREFNRQTDERIRNLVSAIGEFISTLRTKPPA